MLVLTMVFNVLPLNVFASEDIKPVNVPNLGTVESVAGEVRINSVSKLLEKIYEGKIKEIKKPETSNISSWETFFKQYMLLDLAIVIESETLETDDLSIGKITGVSTNLVKLLCFDPVGKWENKPIDIPFSDITSVSFGDRYSVTIFKYVK